MSQSQFKPLWSIDLLKTERWLSSMAEDGWHLTGLSKWTSRFHFQQSEPADKVYQITFNKNQGPELSRSLSAAGWKTAVKSGNWLITENSQNLMDIPRFPVREGLLLHNQKRIILSSMILSYLFFNVFVILAIGLFDLLFADEVEIVSSPYWILTFMGGVLELAVLAILIYIIFTLKKVNKSLQQITDSDKAVLPYNKAEEKKMKQEGKVIVKWKPGWVYAPDRLTDWLEEMEKDGLHLYRIGGFGNSFYFFKDRSHLFSYEALYENMAVPAAEAFHRETGWSCVFRSPSSLQKWSLWRKEYTGSEPKPELLSDQNSRVKHAKRIALTYTCTLLPLVMMYIYFLWVNNQQHQTADEISFVSLSVLYLIMVIQFSIFAGKTWLYYFRIRNKA